MVRSNAVSANRPDYRCGMSAIRHDAAALDVCRAARFLGVSKVTIYRYVAARQIPHLRIGRRLLFDPDELESWRAAHRVPTIAEEFKAVSG